MLGTRGMDRMTFTKKLGTQKSCMFRLTCANRIGMVLTKTDV